MAQKYHINKHGIPAPCHAKKGNCPLGGETQHFDTQEEAQQFADDQNEKEYGLMPSEKIYQGSPYNIYNNAKEGMTQKLTNENVKEVLDAGFESAGDERFDVTYNTDSFTGPVEMDVAVRKVGEDTYNIKGNIYENSMLEEDFDTIEEYDEYLERGPDVSHTVNYDFDSEGLKDTLTETGKLGKSGVSPEQTPGAITSGIFEMSYNNIT